VNEEARGTGGSGQERMSEIKILEAVNFLYFKINFYKNFKFIIGAKATN
jgi:hypothetical protein